MCKCSCPHLFIRHREMLRRCNNNNNSIRCLRVRPFEIFTQIYVSYNKQISVTNQLLSPAPTGDSTNICYSFKHAGLYLHICRLLRPIWKKKCILSADGNSSITNFDCAQILDDLYGVKSFIDTFTVNNMSNYINQHSMGSAMGAFQGNDNTLNRQQLEQAMTEEKKSIGALALFISKCRSFFFWTRYSPINPNFRTCL